MLRLLGFFILVLATCFVLRELPIIGAVFRIPLLGFWLTAILLSVGASRWVAYSLDRRKQRTLEKQLGAVDTPYNKGKLGTLVLSQGRTRRALPLLEEAARGEPESAEWAYRLGQARLMARDLAGARAELERAAAMDEEYAYGAVLLRLAEVLQADGAGEEALEVLARFERNHGANPESAYRRGLALASLRRGAGAKQAFDEVVELGRQSSFQKRGASAWVLRAWWAGLFA